MKSISMKGIIDTAWAFTLGAMIGIYSYVRDMKMLNIHIDAIDIVSIITILKGIGVAYLGGFSGTLGKKTIEWLMTLWKKRKTKKITKS